MASLGPTFGGELIALGLGGLPLTWPIDGSSDDIEGRDLLTTEQNALLDQAIAAHDSMREPLLASSISDRQFAHELRARGIITQAEALAFVSAGVIPAALQALIDALPTQAERDDATLIVAGATVFERNHPLTLAFSAGFGWTAEQTDAFFRAAALR